MLGIENKDSSFFTVESNDIDVGNKILERNLISLNITEKESAMPQGTLSFYDPDDWFSDMFRTGIKIKLSWGYKKSGISPDSLLAKKLNTDEISGSMIRRGFEAFISSPTGSGGLDGVKRFNCNFTAFGFRGTDRSKSYTVGNKSDVIADAFDDLGVTADNRFISFSLGKDTLSKDKNVRQDESTFAFLNRLAREWRCLFHVGFAPTGQPVAVFVDGNTIGDPKYASLFLGASGVSNVIGYKGKLSNVIQYTWDNSESENGVGANVRMDIIDGQIVFRRFVAEEEQVVTYRLNIEKIQKVYDDVDDLGSQTRLMTELLSKKTFKQIEHFFTAYRSPTAPQGRGYRIKCKMIGNPLFSPPNEVKINNGFPRALGGSQSKWYNQSTTHTIDRNGYTMNCDIVDVFTLSPIGLIVR